MTKKCKKTRKTSFKTQKAADRAKLRIWSHDPQADIFDLHSYLCPHAPANAPHWHVGHKSYFQKAQARILQAIPASEKV